MLRQAQTAMTQLPDLDRILQRAQIGSKEMTETKTYELTHDEVQCGHP